MMLLHDGVLIKSPSGLTESLHLFLHVSSFILSIVFVFLEEEIAFSGIITSTISVLIYQFPVDYNGAFFGSV